MSLLYTRWIEMFLNKLNHGGQIFEPWIQTFEIVDFKNMKTFSKVVTLFCKTWQSSGCLLSLRAAWRVLSRDYLIKPVSPGKNTVL